ncbi:Rhamnulokinase [Streptomyces lividans 1326]|uniref:Rhamnulokinase n=1 Tax=Streptomyces lividans 1326 TaxID=1200984 RepID=A0A7U9DPT3_STRLI|nr:Rhamnulokinase [Streptomyces lividans 1326]
MSTAIDTKAFAAVDLGASSGRVMVGRVGADRLELTEAHRFPNRPVRTPDGLRWDVLALYAGVLDGLRAAGRVDSVGVDSWAVDHGLLDADGVLLGNPVHYRDARTEGVAERVWASLPARGGCTRRRGCSTRPSTPCTSSSPPGARPSSRRPGGCCSSPDLLTYWLTGEQGTELTNASTTQLIDPRTRDWSREVADRLGIDLGLFAPLRRPGDPAGLLRPEVLEETGLAGPGAGDGRRFARHRLRGRRRTGIGRTVRLHLHRHLVAGRARTVRSRADPGEPGRQLHQRAGAGRHGPIPAQHHGAVAAPGVRAGLGRPGPG